MASLRFIILKEARIRVPITSSMWPLTSPRSTPAEVKFTRRAGLHHFRPSLCTRHAFAARSRPSLIDSTTARASRGASPSAQRLHGAGCLVKKLKGASAPNTDAKSCCFDAAATAVQLASNAAASHAGAQRRSAALLRRGRSSNSAANDAVPSRSRRCRPPDVKIHTSTPIAQRSLAASDAEARETRRRNAYAQAAPRARFVLLAPHERTPKHASAS